MEFITTERKEHVFLIGLNRPAKMNAFNLQMLREFAEAYTALQEDEDLWCGLVFAHGDHFTAGLDLGNVGPAVKEGKLLFPDNLVDPVQITGRERTKPIVYAVKGYCLTIGIEAMLAGDITVAAKDTKFGQIEIKRGFIPFGGATFRMYQRAGWSNAMRYLLTGDFFSGEEAYRIGLVQETVDGDPFDKAFEIAKTITQQAPLAAQATIKAMYQYLKEGEKAAKADLLTDAIKLMQTEDANEGLNAFLERREAQFKGK